MASSSFPGDVTLTLIIVAVLLVLGSNAQPDVTQEELSCNGRDIDLLSDYARARDFALRDAVSRTPYMFFDYLTEQRYQYGEGFSHGKCFGHLSKEECERCLEVANREILASCAQNTEGWVQLKDCFIGFWEFPIH